MNYAQIVHLILQTVTIGIMLFNLLAPYLALYAIVILITSPIRKRVKHGRNYRHNGRCPACGCELQYAAQGLPAQRSAGRGTQGR